MFFYVTGKSLTGKLSCLVTGLVYLCYPMTDSGNSIIRSLHKTYKCLIYLLFGQLKEAVIDTIFYGEKYFQFSGRIIREKNVI